MANGTIDGPILPASTYKDSKTYTISRDSDDEEQGFLPMRFDPTPAPGPPPMARKEVPRHDDAPALQSQNKPRDYFGTMSGKPSGRELLKEEPRPSSSRSGSTERDRANNRASPHILHQAKGSTTKMRGTSGSNTPNSGSGVASPALTERPKSKQNETATLPANQNDGFRLQEVPASRKAVSRTSSKASGRSPTVSSPASFSPAESSLRGSRDQIVSQSPASQESGVNPFDDPKRKDGGSGSSAPKQPLLPVRGDSLAPANKTAKPMSPDVPNPTLGSGSSHGRKASTSSIPSLFADAQSTISRNDSGSKAIDSPPVRASFDAPPPRNSSRIAPKTAPNDDFVAPRAPPPAPPASAHRNNESVSTMQSAEYGSGGPISPALRSAHLPKHSMDKPFSMEEEMARIMRGDSKRSVDGSASVLRKMSNAVKHGRSFSDRGLHSAGRHSVNGQPEIGSPMTISSPLLSSPNSKDSSDQLAAQLRRAQQRIVELEAEVNRLEDKVNSSDDIRAANNEIREKRGTMVVLDTQREMVVRELEVMTEHLSRAKDSNQPLDLNMLKSEVLKDFAESLQSLKDNMSAQVEDLMHRRNELTDEIGNLIQMKDKGFQEYETLSSKNAQLVEMNSQILHSIQDVYKTHRGPNGTGPAANGLGIYHAGGKADIAGPSEVRQLNLMATDSSLPNLLQENEAEPATILTAPQVVNIRKGQPKKFNWRKGGERVAKNVTKGIKGAFVSERKEGDPPYNIGMPYNQTQQAIGGSEQNGLNGRKGLDGPAFGFFGQKGPAGGLKPGALGTMKNGSSTNLALDASGELTELVRWGCADCGYHSALRLRARSPLRIRKARHP